jgi:hypothetical protein
MSLSLTSLTLHRYPSLFRLSLPLYSLFAFSSAYSTSLLSLSSAGKKYYNRMLKHGPLVPSLKAYEVLMKSLSKAENWKEVAHVYTDLVKRYSTEENRREEFNVV